MLVRRLSARDHLGPNKVAMPKLREIAESVGWTDVGTYINSGNLVFTSAKKPATLERELQAALSRELGRTIDVTVRSRAQLERIVADNPYPHGAANQVNVAVLMKPLPDTAERAIAGLATERDPSPSAGRKSMCTTKRPRRSKLAEKFATVIQISATTRNIGTGRRSSRSSAGRNL